MEKTWIIKFDTTEGSKTFIRTGDIDEQILQIKKDIPRYRAYSYRVIKKPYPKLEELRKLVKYYL